MNKEFATKVLELARNFVGAELASIMEVEISRQKAFRLLPYLKTMDQSYLFVVVNDAKVADFMKDKPEDTIQKVSAPLYAFLQE